jgi:hypothetical protein
LETGLPCAFVATKLALMPCPFQDTEGEGSTQAYPVPNSDPGPAPSQNRMLQAVMSGMRQVVRGRLEGPSGQTVTKIFDRCRDAVTAAGARGRASPGEQGRGAASPLDRRRAGRSP